MSTYRVVIRLWMLFMLQLGMYAQRWAFAELSADAWTRFMDFVNDNSASSDGVVDNTVLLYCRMLSHLLCLVCGCGYAFHRSQLRIVDDIVHQWVARNPFSRRIPNKKWGWDAVLVEMAMRVADVWDVYGHVNFDRHAYFLVAKVCLSVLVYSGWRPFVLSRDRTADARDPRWVASVILPCRQLHVYWGDVRGVGSLCAGVSFSGLRTKFHHSPRQQFQQVHPGFA
jgi:hypothetical protein